MICNRYSWKFGCMVFGGAMLLAAGVQAQTADAETNILEGYPPDMAASLASLNRKVSSASNEVKTMPRYWIIPKVYLWRPGSTIRVAFKGGNPELYEKIEAAANEWTKPGVANVKFQFKDADGKYFQWTDKDTEYAAHIRISFDKPGYWSVLGVISLFPEVLGGRPGDASMNFDSYDKKLPPSYAITVMHEFGHALGFNHEHQNPIGGCDFRFDDDAGYEVTRTKDGVFVTDKDGRRPGLYTFLSGAFNFWTRETVDHNLRAMEPSSAFLGSNFDGRSIMKYAMKADMFVAGEKSPCYTAQATELSELDKEGARRAYPTEPAAVSLVVEQQRSLVKELKAGMARMAPAERSAGGAEQSDPLRGHPNQ